MAKTISIFSNGSHNACVITDEEYSIFVNRSRELLKEERPKEKESIDSLTSEEIIKKTWGGYDYNNWNKENRRIAFSLDPYSDDDDEYIPQDHDALLIDSTSSPEKESEAAYFEKHFEEIVHALLPRSEAEVYIREVKDEMNQEEIGEALGKTSNAVSKLYCKAKKRLEEYGFKTFNDFISSEQYAAPTPFKERGHKS